MTPTNDLAASHLSQDVSAVLEGAAYLTAIERRLATYFERAEPRPRAMASVRGLRSTAERQNNWPLAEASGDTTPDAVQHLLRRALNRHSSAADSRTNSVSHGKWCPACCSR